MPNISTLKEIGLLILSAVGLPFMAIIFFTLFEASNSAMGLWALLTDAGIDLCQVSIGIVGALFLDFQVRGAGTYAVVVLMLNLIIAGVATLIKNRAVDMGMTQRSTQALSIVTLGVFAMAVPAVLIVLNGSHLWR